jgi:hypothetical protein
MGCGANCGANSCQPEVLSVAEALVCACTDRTVMKTCSKLPLGFLQLGGSLMETLTVPIPEEGVMDIEELPPLQP